jgi:hypothetical protein
MADSTLQNLQNFFKKRNQEVREEKKEILQLIGSFLEDIEKSSFSEMEKEEAKKRVIDLGRFIQFFDSKLIIEEVLKESFIIKKKANSIGLIHYNFNGNFESTNNELTKETVISVIQEEESKFEEFQKEHWLLLVIGGIQDSGDYSSFEKTIFSSEYESSFDKIFLLNSFKGEVKFLNIKS